MFVDRFWDVADVAVDPRLVPDGSDGGDVGGRGRSELDPKVDKVGDRDRHGLSPESGVSDALRDWCNMVRQ